MQRAHTKNTNKKRNRNERKDNFKAKGKEKQEEIYFIAKRKQSYTLSIQRKKRTAGIDFPAMIL